MAIKFTNTIKTLALATLVSVSLTGCEDTLYENVNPDVAHKNTPELGLPVVVFYASQINYDHAEYGTYLSQCLTTMGKSQNGSLAYQSGWQFLTMNRHPQWRRHFYDIGVNVNELIKNSQEIGSPNYELIGRTIRLMSTQLTTDAFGDIPRSEAYLSNSPTYDTQESVYAWMFQEAEDLIKMYEDPNIAGASASSRSIDQAQDRVYGGDLQKWKGLVYAIKARLLLRNLPNIDRSAATCNNIIATAQQAIDTWRSGDMLYGSWFGNEPRYNFGPKPAQGALVGESNAQWSSAQPVINSWESRANGLENAVPSKFFMENCMGVINPGVEMTQGFFDRENGYGSDPRLALILEPRTGPISASRPSERVMIRYLENNIGAGSAYKKINFPNLYCGAYAGSVDAYTPLFTMEELYFIQAEAYYWLGNKVKACELTKEATRYNVERHLERYLLNNGNYPDSGNKPGAAAAKDRFERIMTAFFDNEATKRCKPCTQIGNKHWFFNPSEFSLSDLMMQKYISMYLQPEQWTDMRRYHFSNNRNGYGIGDNREIIYPGLRRPYNLYQAYWIDGLSEEEKENAWVQRINYDPETEEKYNLKELERLGAAKNHLWLRKPMIWAQDYGVKTSLTVE